MESKPPFERKNVSRDEASRELEILKLIFDKIEDGAVITDANGFITHINEIYGDFLGIDRASKIGKHCTEVFENSRLHIVGKTGKAEMNHTLQINNKNMIVHRIPIIRDGKVVAVFGHVMMRDIRGLKKLMNKMSALESKIKHYEKELNQIRSKKHTFSGIIGASKAITDLKQQALRAAGKNFAVLITGESGTGKGLFAHAIHNASPRRGGPFIHINCAAIPKDLLESELFGYEKGAFTGAKNSGKPGKFELAEGGTVFLDEIGDLPLEMQPKLLRVLEEKQFERVGSTEVLHTDFRLIAATNQNLEEMMNQSKFRRDLFYRLNVLSLHIPPLRERRSDILPITHHLLDELSDETEFFEIKLDATVQKALRSHDWPGNARELSNVLERAVASMEGNTIVMDDLPFSSDGKEFQKREQPTTIRRAQHMVERDLIKDALEENDYNKTRAARALGIHRTLLYKKMKKLNLPLKSVEG